MFLLYEDDTSLQQAVNDRAASLNDRSSQLDILGMLDSLQVGSISEDILSLFTDGSKLSRILVEHLGFSDALRETIESTWYYEWDTDLHGDSWNSHISPSGTIPWTSLALIGYLVLLAPSLLGKFAKTGLTGLKLGKNLINSVWRRDHYQTVDRVYEKVSNMPTSAGQLNLLDDTEDTLTQLQALANAIKYNNKSYIL